MKLVLTLSLLALGACVEAASPTSVNELLMAQAEAKAYRAAWIELQRRDEILGLSTLSNDVQDSHDQVVRLSGELIRAERYAKQMQDQMGKVVDAAAIWAGEPIPAKKLPHGQSLSQPSVFGTNCKKTIHLVPWQGASRMRRLWRLIASSSRSF